METGRGTCDLSEFWHKRHTAGDFQASAKDSGGGHVLCLAETGTAMPISLEHERDNVFRLDVRGMLRLTELEECQQRLTGEMARIGSARLLFVLDGFKGWDPQDRWNDLSFYVKYGDAIQRIAIVGPEQWRSETLMFVGADLRRAPVGYFVEGAIAEARAWLTA
jgi:hypothetical protein